MTYQFEEAEVPSQNRPNPFSDIVAKLAEAFKKTGSSKAVTFTIPAGTPNGTITSQLDRAAKGLDVTIRREYEGNDVDTERKATIWATHKRAPKGTYSGAAA